MKILSNPHTHSLYCDGKSTIAEMADSARSLGFVSLGFSGHGHQNFDVRFSMSGENTVRYLADLRALKAECAGRMRIYAGVERDYYAELNPADYDYSIGSVHYLFERDEPEAIRSGECADNPFYAVDGNPERLCEGVKKLFHGDGLAFAAAYYELLARHVEENRPEIIGHFDIVRKNNPACHFFDERDKAYLRLAKDALERVAPRGALLEVNTGGMVRGYLPDPYPQRELLMHAKALGMELIVSSDCHMAGKLDFAFEDTARMLNELGFDHVNILSGTPGAMFEKVAL